MGAVLVQVLERLPRACTREDLARLGLHLGEQPVVLRPAVGVRLVQVQVGAVEVPRPAGVALAAHRVGPALDGGGVHRGHPVAQCDDGGGGAGGRGVQLGAQGLRAAGGEVLEEGRCGAVLAGPGGQLADHGLGGARAAVQTAVQAELQGLAVAGEGGRDGAQPLGDGRPVLVGVRRGQREDLADRVHGAVDVADRAQVLVGLVDGEFGGEAFAEQAAAAALGVAVGAGQRLGGVEAGEGLTGEPGDGGAARRGEVGELGGALGYTQVRTGDRVEGDEAVDVIVGHLAGQPGGAAGVEGL